MKAVLCLALLCGTASADAIGPGPPCPKGQTSEADHGGGYCQPRAPRCAKGERAVPTRGAWYCEPPPPKGGCPTGSIWRSTSRTDTWCDGQRRSCEMNEQDPRCVQTSLCVTEITREYRGRMQGSYVEERVFGVCGKDGSCADGKKCVAAKRFVPEPAPRTQPSPPPKKGALLLLPLFALAVAVGAAFRRRRQEERTR